jgi:hypothetical protein
LGRLRTPPKLIPFRYLLTDPRQFDILQNLALAGGDRMQFDQLKRREFITLLGGAAAAWPLAARAQRVGKLPTIGFLGASTPSAWSQWTAAFVQRLRELGWTEGRTVAIEYRWAQGHYDRFPALAADLVRPGCQRANEYARPEDRCTD